MRKICCILFFILLRTAASAQLPASYAAVDRYVQDFPMQIGSAGDMRVFINEMSRVFTNDGEKIRAVYYWITENISYDCAGYHNNLLVSVQIDNILRSRKAVCAGYAALMHFACGVMNIECRTIEGTAGTHMQNAFIHPDSLKTNHAWNAVKLNGEWKLIDATWASGYCDREVTKFTKRRDDACFLMKPASFIYRHLPDDSTWQPLKDTVVTKKAFCSQPLVSSGYFDYQIENAAPFTIDLYKKIGDTIRFQFCTRHSLDKILIFSEEKPGVHVSGSLLKSQDCYYYEYAVRHAGQYDLNIGFSGGSAGNQDNENSPHFYSSALTYRLKVKPLKPALHKVR